MLLNDLKKDRNLLVVVKKLVLFGTLFFALDAGTGIFLTVGLNKYYGLNEPSEIALVGHSHLMLGINKNVLEQQTGKKISKYTREGVNIADRDVMIDQLLDANQNLKIVVYGVDAWMFTGEGLSANSYKLFYPFMKNSRVANYIKENASFTDYWQHKLIRTSGFNEGLVSSSFRGYLKNWSNLKLGVVDTLKLKAEILEEKVRNINSSEHNRKLLEQSIQKMLKMNVKVVLCYVPTIDLYNKIDAEKFMEEIAYFKSLAANIDGIYYFEYIDDYSQDYSLFFDPIHLNPKGQKLITEVLASDLKLIIDN